MDNKGSGQEMEVGGLIFDLLNIDTLISRMTDFERVVLLSSSAAAAPKITS